MSASGRVLTRLPARAQDFLRLAADTLNPRRRHEIRSRHKEACSSIDFAALVSPTGRVLGGPFKDLRLPLDGQWGGLHARLAGTYEYELEASVEQLISVRPGLIIDVGCAEGYYAVGFARRVPSAKVIAFDIDPRAQKECRSTAITNRVSNVRVRGRITPQLLDRTLTRNVEDAPTLIICDCEGYELELFDPERVPALRSSRLLIELHECFVPGVTATLVARLTRTHVIDLIDAIPRDGLRPDHLAHLNHEETRRAVEEGRDWSIGPQQWLVAHPRSEKLAANEMHQAEATA